MVKLLTFTSLISVSILSIASTGSIPAGRSQASQNLLSSNRAEDRQLIANAQSIKAPALLRIGYQAIPNGDLVVKHNKWLETALPKTRIQWVKFESGGDVNTAFIAKAIDIGLAGSSPVTRGLSAPNFIPYSVPWIHDVIGSAESLVVRSKTGITTVAGLKGKKIGTPFASTAHFSVLAALKLAGLKETDVRLVDLQPTDLLAAWSRGDIDAAYVWDPTLAQLRKSGATVLTSSALLAEKGYPTYDLAVVSNSLRTQYPQVVQLWIKQQDRAVRLIKSDPATAAKAIGPELNLKPQEVLSQLKGLVFLDARQQASPKFLGSPQQPGQFSSSLLKAAQFLKTQGKITAVPSIESLRAAIDTTNLNKALPK